MAKIRAAILGATGVVGQRLVAILSGHPWFDIGALTASAQSTGKPYVEACAWRLHEPMPIAVRQTTLQPTVPGMDCPVVFSALKSRVASELEDQFARAGHAVVSNASVHRMAPDVPLIIPEINPEHLDLIAHQKETRGYGWGLIVTNPNCAVVPLAMVLAPIQRRWGVKRVIMTSLQAVSGAGYPGVSSIDILDNIIPHINGEEEKIESEANKILGRIDSNAIKAAEFTVSSQAFRVPVTNGHLLSVSIQLHEEAPLKEVHAHLEAYSGAHQARNLPSSPDSPIHFSTDPDRPQPKLDRDRAGSMAITVGRLRKCPALHFKLVILGHNTIRGAAGAAVLNGELLQKAGYLT